MGSENERETGHSFARRNNNNNSNNNNNNNNNNNSDPMEISIAEATSMFPGFRFSPTDVELIRYYLTNKLQGSHDKGDVDVISEVDICRHEPWDLPAQSIIQSENEWFFFSPRGRKYPNGSQSKRATEYGYWKATGKERSVKSGSTVIGTKRTLVFHMGRAPKGQRTEWIMHEYCTREKSQDAMVICRLRKNQEFHLNDTPRGKSPNQIDHLNVNDDIIVLSDGEQSNLLEEAKVVDSGSKEDSSSYSSHSIDQGYVEEENFYADILKDDIVTLDDALLNIKPQLLPTAAHKLKPETMYAQPAQATAIVVPFQGTANRRLRLRRQRTAFHHAEPFGMYKFDKESRLTENTPDSISQRLLPSRLGGHLPNVRIRHLVVFFFLFMLICICALLAFRGIFVASRQV